MNDFKVKIAAAISPIMQYLYEAGILDIRGFGSPMIQTTERFFRETFPIYETVKVYGRTELHYEYEGVLFFCIASE